MRALLLVASLALGAPDAPPGVPPPADVIAACDAALEAADAAGLQRCVEAWVLSDPTNPETDWYAFHLAMAQANATAAQAAKNRALARGLSDEKSQQMQKMGLPPNPMLTIQRVFLAVVLLFGLVGMIWARYRHIAERDILESAEAESEG